MMSRLFVRTFGALAVATLLATTSTAAIAATQASTPTFHLAKKKVTTLRGLSVELRARAVRLAQARPGAQTLTSQGGSTQSGPSDTELDATCNHDWFITWDEDADGNAIVGSYNLHCAGQVIPIG